MDTGVTYRTQGCTRVQVIHMDSRHVYMMVLWLKCTSQVCMNVLLMLMDIIDECIGNISSCHYVIM